MIYGVIAAVMTIQGKDFRYIVIGRRLEQYMSEGKTAKARELIAYLKRRNRLDDLVHYLQKDRRA